MDDSVMANCFGPPCI